MTGRALDASTVPSRPPTRAAPAPHPHCSTDTDAVVGANPLFAPSFPRTPTGPERELREDTGSMRAGRHTLRDVQGPLVPLVSGVRCLRGRRTVRPSTPVGKDEVGVRGESHPPTLTSDGHQTHRSWGSQGHSRDSGGRGVRVGLRSRRG